MMLWNEKVKKNTEKAIKLKEKQKMNMNEYNTSTVTISMIKERYFFLSREIDE